MSAPTCPYVLDVVARTGPRFTDFAPYVAAMAEDGRVCFQAGLPDGGSGVFAAAGGGIDCLVDAATAGLAEIVSHPDLTRVPAGDATCFYGRRASGAVGAFALRGGRLVDLGELADAPALRDAGPLGPTMNAGGAMAFRGHAPDGAQVVALAIGDRVVEVARTGERFASFDGLPAVTDGGAVAVRAQHASGRQGIHLWRDGALAPVIETGERFAELGRFPVAVDGGVVAFAAVRTDGSEGVFRAAEGAIETLVDSRAGFASFRGVLLAGDGAPIYFATPPGGVIGIYAGPDRASDRVLAIGDELDGLAVTGFVLNPVSINRAGQLAIRVELADGTQRIVRADPRR